MSEARSPARAAMGRAGRRAAFHLLQAAVESLKAVEAVIEEIGAIGEEDAGGEGRDGRQRIEVE